MAPSWYVVRYGDFVKVMYFPEEIVNQIGDTKNSIIPIESKQGVQRIGLSCSQLSMTYLWFQFLGVIISGDGYHPGLWWVWREKWIIWRRKSVGSGRSLNEDRRFDFRQSRVPGAGVKPHNDFGKFS